MKRIIADEIRSIYLLTGLFAGLLSTIVFFVIIFILLGKSFSFNELAALHSDHPIIIIADSFVLIGLIAGLISGKRKLASREIVQQLQRNQRSQKDFLIPALENLSKGSMNIKMESSDVDGEIIASMKSLQNRLKENRETEKQTRLTEQQRSWTSEGLAMFGDILRADSDDQERLTYQIIANLVRYLDINQGGFFLVAREGEERYLDMAACHAYDRNKFPDKRLAWGEGLIGAVAIEQKSYHTNKISDDYLTITSGLGRATPKNLLLVPLVLNEEVFGVFELASFKPFEDYMIQFVERVAENTATTLNIMRSNLRTAQLLEETREQAEKLAIQEERVRQNIEELKETQINAAKQAEQFVNFSNTVNHTLIRAEYDASGILTYANTLFLRKLGYAANSDVEGKSVTTFILPSDHQWFDGIWKRLSKGGRHYEGYMRHQTKTGQEIWTMATYTCMRKESGEIDRILFLALDSTETKQEQLYLSKQLEAVDSISAKAEFGPDGRLLQFNEQLEKSLNYNSKELLGKNVFDFILPKDQERFNEVWEQVIAGNDFLGQIRMAGKYEEETWFRISLKAITDIYGEVDKVIFLAYDVSREKEMEQNLLEQQDRLKAREEELRLQNLDLRKEINTTRNNFEIEKEESEHEKRKLFALLDHSPYPTLTVNNQGYIETINASAGKIFKVKTKDLLKMPINTLLSGNQKDPRLNGIVSPGIPVQNITRTQISITLKDGAVLDVTASIYTTVTGKERLYTLVVHDK